MNTIFFNLGLVILLVAVNGYFVAAEFSLVSIRSTRVDQLVEDGNVIARFIQKSKQDPGRFLSASQTGITLASLALGWVGEPAISEILLGAFGRLQFVLGPVVLHTVATVITFILITYIHIVLGELVPKALALQRTEPTLLLTAWPMRFLTVAFTPFIIVLQRSTKWLLGLLGIEQVPEHHLVYSEDELKRIVSASHEVGILEAHEQDMLHKVFAFSDKVAREVMIPRPDIKALSVNVTWHDLLAEVREHAHTRFPVYEENIDNVIGVFHAKDLFAFLSERPIEEFNMRALIREVPFVPESKPVDDLLTELKKGKTQIAIVMDEFGGTAGLVTLEDLLEEIVGEIADEFDDEHPEIEMIGPGQYLLDGRYRIAEFNDRFASGLPTDDFDTMAGLVFGTLGREPQVGDEVALGDVSFTVKHMEGHRITRLALHLRPVVGEVDDSEPLA
jgi:CBS domain containing-hemolysin-like protein